MKTCINWMLLLLISLTFAASTRAEMVVVVSSRSPVTSLTSAQIARIFLGKVARFPNDGAALPIDLPEGSEIREEFYSKVAHKNSSQLSAYWAKVIFTGEGNPPILATNDVAVRKTVAGNPSAIGYIDKSAVNHSVRVILEP
jgi:ABC-type phosphate transport system substrate-binding protein